MPPDSVQAFAARQEPRPPGRIPHSATTLGELESEAIARVVASGLVSQGAEVAAFEEECAAFVGRRYAVAVNSGTAALQLALRVLGVGPGSPVAQPSYACAALITANHHLGAEPVLCDCGAGFNVDGDAYPPDCDAVIAVHLFGATASLPTAANVIEDIAQSFGGRTGKGGVISVTSFYATKMMTTGEGGMLFTDDEWIADEARDLRDYDNRDSYRVRYAMKMTDLQAAMGRVQLEQLPEFVLYRREIAARYSEAFADLPIDLPRETGHVYFRYVIGVDRRDAFGDHLARNGIDAKRPVYRPAHHYLGGEYPNAERAHRRAVSLPIYPSLSGAEVNRVIESVLSFFD